MNLLFIKAGHRYVAMPCLDKRKNPMTQFSDFHNRALVSAFVWEKEVTGVYLMNLKTAIITPIALMTHNKILNLDSIALKLDSNLDSIVSNLFKTFSISDLLFRSTKS